MQRTLVGVEARAGETAAPAERPTNFNYSLARCQTDRLKEQMTVEKAICVLKVPQTRNSNAIDRRMLADCFSTQVINKRIRIPPEDPEYKRKIEGRHVLDLLVHESYQFMMKHVRQQASGVVSVAGLSEVEARKEEERERKVKKKEEVKAREQALERAGLMTVGGDGKGGKKRYVSPAVQRIIEEYWKDDDEDELDSILRRERPPLDYAAIFEK